MANNTTMQLGSYSFVPVPLLSINRNVYKAGDESILGYTYEYTLEGVLSTFPSTTGGYIQVDELQDDLEAAFRENGQRFLVQCNSETLIDAYPIIDTLSIQRSTDNWTISSPFTITMHSFESAPGSGTEPFIREASESWNLNFVEDKSYYDITLPNGSGDTSPIQLRLSHTVSAVGTKHYNNGLPQEAWQNARDYVIGRLGYDATQVGASGVFNLTTANFAEFNHERIQTVDELGGSFAVTENWYVINPSGAGTIGNAVEDFTISTKATTPDSIFTTVSIEGQVQGLETKDYGTDPGDFAITQSMYSAASGAWNTVYSRLYQRARLVGDGVAVRDINIVPLSLTVAHSPSKGTISYNAEYNDRPYGCVEGALSEIITINDVYNAQSVSTIFVLGKTNGVLLQDLSMGTPQSKELNIEILMAPPTGCITSGVGAYVAQAPFTQTQTIVDSIEDYLETQYSQVFRTSDNSSWTPNIGRFNRNVVFAVQNC